MADTVEAGQLLDVEMDELAGTFALVSDNRRLRIEGLQPAKPGGRKVAGDGCPRQGQMRRDLRRRQSVSAQAQDHRHPRCRELVRHDARPAGAILETGQTLGTVARQPFADGPHAHREGSGDGPRRPALDLDPTHHHRSTKRRRSRILVNTHPGHLPRQMDGWHQPTDRDHPG
jgi:hypothetical protein